MILQRINKAVNNFCVKHGYAVSPLYLYLGQEELSALIAEFLEAAGGRGFIASSIDLPRFIGVGAHDLEIMFVPVPSLLEIGTELSQATKLFKE